MAEQRVGDQEILEHIRRHPIAREEEIARALGLTRAAIHKRIVKLKKMKRLRSGMTVDLNAIGFDHKYRIDIKINPRRLRRAVEAAQDALDNGKTTIAEIDKEPDQEKRELWKDGRELFDAVKEWHNLKNHQEILAFHILNIGSKNPNILVEDVSVLLGDPADLCATVRIRSAKEEISNRNDDPIVNVIYRLVTEDLRGLSSIDTTSTCIEAWSCSHEMQQRLLEERPKRAPRKPRETDLPT